MLCLLDSVGAVVTQSNAGPLLTFVVFTLFPETHDQPVRSGRTRHSSPSRHGSILHHHFWRTIEAAEKHATAEGHFLDGRTSEKYLFGKKTPESDVTLSGPWKPQQQWTPAKLTNLALLWQIIYSCHVRNFRWREVEEGLSTFNTRGQSPCCPRHLSWEAGALYCLRAFFNLVLIAATMSSNHFTSTCPLLLWPCQREFKGKLFLYTLHMSQGTLSDFSLSKW